MIEEACLTNNFKYNIQGIHSWLTQNCMETVNWLHSKWVNKFFSVLIHIFVNHNKFRLKCIFIRCTVLFTSMIIHFQFNSYGFFLFWISFYFFFYILKSNYLVFCHYMVLKLWFIMIDPWRQKEVPLFNIKGQWP